MATSIRDRLQAKLKKSDKPKRNLSSNETAELQTLLRGYSTDVEVTKNQIKLLRETDDQKLVDAIFAKIEDNCAGDYYSYALKAASAKFVYLLNEKSLIKKLEDYNLNLIKNGIEVAYAVERLFYGSSRIKKKVIAAIPPENDHIVFKILNILPKDCVDAAVSQFSQPQYSSLPLLVLLAKDYLSEDQIESILGTITKEGLQKHIKFYPIDREEVNHKIAPRLVKKIVEVGWDFWGKRTEFMSLPLVVLTFLNSEKRPEHKTKIEGNLEYINRAEISTLQSFCFEVFLLGLAKRIDLKVDDDRFDFELEIK